MFAILFFMNSLDRELRYINKLENDVLEGMYDLLVQHLEVIADPDENKMPVSKGSVNVGKLINVLDRAISDLRLKVNRFNKRQFNRYILIVCNRILRYDTSRKDLKDLKTEIIDDFTNSEHEFKNKIPLDYQINELRITYDTSYAFYLINRFISKGEWANALYFVIACRLLEPDDERIDYFYKTINEHLEPKTVTKELITNPQDMVLVLDSNIIINKLNNLINQSHYHNKQINYKHKKTDLKSLNINNKIIITNSVKHEIEEFIEAELSKLKKRLQSKEFSKIKKQLNELFNEFINKYYQDVGLIDKLTLKQVKEFYNKYTVKLELVTMSKLKFGTVSKKLRKLAQRKFLLPEKGDLHLIAEVIKLNKENNEEYIILSDDKDLTLFSGNLNKELNVKIYNTKE